MTASATDAGRFRPDQQSLIKIVLIAIVAILVIGPLIILVRASLAPSGTLPMETSTLTLENFRQVFSSSSTARILWNTALYAFGSITLGVSVAAMLAWLTERTDMPGRTFIRVILFSWMAIPPVVIGFGWILLINPSNGVLNVLAKSLFGLQQAPLTIYSFWALIIISAFSVVPTAFVMLGGLFRNMDPELENAGHVAGAGWYDVSRRISIPLVLPGLVSVFIFMFMIVVQAFEIPLIVGLTARIPVLSTRVYLLATPFTGIPNYSLSAAFGVLLLCLAGGLMWLYFRTVGAGERFRVVTGRAFRPRRVRLGRLRYGALFFCLTFFSIMLLPLAILLWTSLFPFYRIPSLETLPEMSFAVYARVLAQPQIQMAAANTVILVLGSATLVMILSSMIAWFSVRDKGVLARVMDVLSFAPTAIPPIVMAMAILLLYLRTPIYGTLAVLIVGNMTIYLAFGTRTMSTAVLQLHKELTDAAMVSGASWLTMMRRIVIPLVWTQFVNGWLWVLSHSARDLTIPLVLMTSANLVMATAIWMTWDYPDLAGAAALSCLLVTGLLVLVLPMQLITLRWSGER